MTSSDEQDERRISNGVQLQHLRGMYDELDGWRERSRRVEDPEPGSDMARDTQATHGLGTPFHDLARHQLVSGTQLLNMARALASLPVTTRSAPRPAPPVPPRTTI